MTLLSEGSGVTRALRFRLRPTSEQEAVLRQCIGVCRLVYNLALEQRRDFWRQYQRATGRRITYASQSKELTDLRNDFEWIGAAPRRGQEAALRDLDLAFEAYFAGRAGFPRPRKRGQAGFRIPAFEAPVRSLNAKWAKVQLPKVGWVKFRITRPLAGELRTVTVREQADGWYVTFATEIPAPVMSGGSSAVGIDRGVTRTITLSTGEHHQAPSTRSLKRAQQAVARCRPGSNRRAAAKARLAELAARAVRQRTDWCHRVSTDIGRRFSVVALEDLRIENMTASASGKGRAQKAGLNRSILAQSWGRFATMLEYKLAERGGHLITVPAAYTSQTCASCGVVDARSRKSQAVFSCVACGHEDNADVNAAKEILRRSTAWQGVEAGVARPAKRQPGLAPEPVLPGMLTGKERQS